MHQSEKSPGQNRLAPPHPELEHPEPEHPGQRWSEGGSFGQAHVESCS
jgi:hypothetical protein